MSGHEPAPDHRTERLSFFSDAVFAIAITLLAIEIHVPEPASNGVADHLRALLAMWPSFFAYMLSFLVIARFWIGHHSALALVGRFSPRLVWPNTMLLMAIAFIPFATAYCSSHGNAVVPFVVYNAVLLLTGLASRRVIVLATSPAIRRDGVDVGVVRLLRVRGAAVICGALTALTGSMLWQPGWARLGWTVPPSLAELLLATSPLWLRLLMRHDRRRTKEAAARLHEAMVGPSTAQENAA